MSVGILILLNLQALEKPISDSNYSFLNENIYQSDV